MYKTAPAEHKEVIRSLARFSPGDPNAILMKTLYNHRKTIAPMFLFENSRDNSGNLGFPPFGGGSAMPAAPNKRTVLEALTGEEKPHSIAGLLLLLVCSLHLLGAYRLLQPVEPIKLAQPLMMEVSLVSSSGKQVTTAPPAPPKPVEPIKTKKKPVKKLNKKKQAKPKQKELPKPLLAPQDLMPAPSLADKSAESKDSTDKPAVASAPASASGTQGEVEPYTEASFNANYGTNPKPKYPDIARSRGWQGKVLLRVSVSAEGRSVAVNVQRSSGHDVLDESAVAAVEKWKFIPARRGDTAVACSVLVPIIFTLNH
jgi:periplasmic protein TonB